MASAKHQKHSSPWALMLLTVIVSNAVSLANAQSRPTNGISNSEELEFCATYAPCAIAVGLMKGSETAINLVDSAKRYFNFFGQSSPRTPQAFREYLGGLTRADRQVLVKKCIDVRGQSSDDYCASEFLLDSDRAESVRSKPPTSLSSRLAQLKESLSYVVAEDSRLIADYELFCARGPQNCVLSDDFQSRLAMLRRNLDRLQADPEYLEYFSRYSLRSLQLVEKNFTFDGISWSAKAADEPWKALPTRNADANLTKQLANAVSSSAGTNARVDPFAGTTDRLNPDQIAAARQNYQAARQQDAEILSGLFKLSIELVAQKAALDAAAVAQNAVRTTQNSPRPTTSNSATNYSSNSEFVASTTNSPAGGEGAGNCLSVTRPPNAWAELKNSCSYAVEANWCYVGLDCKYGDWGFTNSATIGPGRSRSASSQGSKSSQYSILFNACKGANASLTEPSKGNTRCKN